MTITDEMKDSLDEALADDGYFFPVVLSDDLRTLTVPKEVPNFGVEGDRFVKTVFFHIPRYTQDVDLSDFEITIYYTNANGEKLAHPISKDQIKVYETYIHFFWILDDKVTEKAGTVRFFLDLTLTKDGKVEKEYKSLPATSTVLLTDTKASDDSVRVDDSDSIKSLIDEYTKENRDVVTKTTDEWDADPDFVGKDGALYIYSDYTTKDGATYPGIKIGDGKTKLSDLSFVAASVAKKDDIGTSASYNAKTESIDLF